MCYVNRCLYLKANQWFYDSVRVALLRRFALHWTRRVNLTVRRWRGEAQHVTLRLFGVGSCVYLVAYDH